MPHKELGIFDWDDTCTLGSKPAYDRIHIDCAHSVGVELPDDEIIQRVNSKWGARHEIIQAEIFKDSPTITFERRSLAAALYWDYWEREFAGLVKLVPSTIEVLKELKYGPRKMKLGLTTAAPPGPLKERVMHQLGFPRDLFDYIITPYDLVDESKAKPHPYTLNKIMSVLQVGPRKTFMVGDSPNDFLAARDANVDFIGVETGMLNRQLARSLAVKHIVANVAEIVPVIEGFEAAS